jgi:hypothetical protein
MCVLHEELEDTFKEVRAKDEQVRAKDEQARAKDEQVRVKDDHIALLYAEIACPKTNMEETISGLSTYKMLFWGLLLICCVGVLNNNMI